MAASRIGKYELLETVGGHECRVYRARDIKLGRTVAIKILPANAEAEQRERLLAEARVSSRLRHPNLIQVLDVSEENGQLFLVMELLNGCTLRDALRDGMAGGIPRKLAIAREVGSALAYIHANNIIHRDVKPENIFLETDGKTKLIDFGVAKIEGMHLTGDGFTLGTPYYMAPEQVRGEHLTPLIDVYAFGVTLYEMLTGRRAVDGKSVDQIFDSILQQPLDLDLLRSNGVGADLLELVRRCTAKRPDDRPQGFAEILRLLH